MTAVKETDKERLERLTSQYLKELYLATVESLKKHITTVDLQPPISDEALDADISRLDPIQIQELQAEFGVAAVAELVGNQTKRWRV